MPLSSGAPRSRQSPSRVWLLMATVALVTAAASAQPRDTPRTFTVDAHKYAFQPARIEVDQNDLVKIVFHSGDIAHSFTIDAYRISKRAAAGGTVTFEFRADTAGTFPFYCDLRIDQGCRRMRGELVVRPR